MIERALLISESYMYADPKQGPTMTEYALSGSLRASGLIQSLVKFCPSEFYLTQGAKRTWRTLLDRCEELQPQLLVLIASAEPFGPPHATLRQITERMGIKTLMIFGDTCNRTGEDDMRSWLPSVSHAAITDSFILNRKYHRQTQKVIELFGTVVNPEIFYDRSLPKDIDVSFVGNEFTHPSRFLYVNYLRKNGIRVLTGGRRNELSIERYAELLNRSKITLNFSATVIGNAQFKGRVLEAMASNTLLFEDYGIETQFIFQPNEDVVIFHNKHDLVQKIRYYLAHEDARHRIAQSAYHKLKYLFNARHCWAHAFHQMGFPLPEALGRDAHFVRFREVLREAYRAVPPVEQAQRIYGRDRSLYVWMLRRLPPFFKFLFRFTPSRLRGCTKRLARRVLTVAYNLRYSLNDSK